MTCPCCKQADPGAGCEGCRFQCQTCGLHLYGKREVEGHWAFYNKAHGVFVDDKGRAHHQTVEGLHRRKAWDRPLSLVGCHA